MGMGLDFFHRPADFLSLEQRLDYLLLIIRKLLLVLLADYHGYPTSIADCNKEAVFVFYQFA